MPKERVPDKQDITEAYQLEQARWSASMSNWEKMDSYYWRTYQVWNSVEQNKNRASYRPSTPASIIDHAADHQLGYEPSITRPVFTEREMEQTRADLIEPFLYAVFRDSSFQEANMTWKQGGRYLLHYGRAVFEGPKLDFSDMPKEPAKEKDESEDEFELRTEIWKAQKLRYNPFRIRAIHPSKVLADPAFKSPPYALHLGTRYYSDLLALSIRKANTRVHAEVLALIKGKKPHDTVPVWDYWTKEWHVLMVANGQWLFAESNPWGFVPYVHAFAGFGQPKTATASDADDPRWQAVGLLEHITDSIQKQAQNASAKHNLLMNASYAPIGTKGNAEEVAQAIARGEMIEGEEDMVWLLKTNQVSRSMIEVGGEITDDIEQGSYARDIAGRRQQGVQTVGQQAILSSASTKKFYAPQRQLEECATIVASNILRLVEVNNLPLNIRGAGIKPEDIARNYAVDVQFEILDPVIDLQQRNVGMQEVDRGLTSPETYRADYAHVKDETRERRRLLDAALDKLPAVMEAEMMAAAKLRGLDKVYQTFLDQQKALQEQEAMKAAKASQNGGGDARLRQPLTADVAKPAPARPGEGP
mgnify:CR=1 FL=1